MGGRGGNGAIGGMGGMDDAAAPVVVPATGCSGKTSAPVKVGGAVNRFSLPAASCTKN
jgi:hypothetical protein